MFASRTPHPFDSSGSAPGKTQRRAWKPGAKRRSSGSLLWGRLPLDPTDLVVIGIAALTAAAVVGAGLAGRPSATASGGESALDAATTPSGGQRIDVITADGASAAGWTDRLGTAFGASVRVLTGDGYTSTSNAFNVVAADVDPTASAVVVLTPATDRSVSAITLASRVTSTVAAINTHSPGAEVLLAGPIVPKASAAGLQRLRDVVHSAAKVTGAHWTDPVTNTWVTAAQVGGDGDLTAGGETAVAAEVGEQLRRLLAS